MTEALLEVQPLPNHKCSQYNRSYLIRNKSNLIKSQEVSDFPAFLCRDTQLLSEFDTKLIQVPRVHSV
ncbi:hypothetical protein ERICI_02107 [Paenibacillus larvae subsp. larvae]|uniref:Uncharacterized protein n=1 Tax=Paenibacillus larvae subsp. larvae TaxID=147375 RepID=A0A2L1UDE4_9BACL|nr:hypothetical protein ERICI_02107 [Paenibacillus larvae subsp. larvae]AVF26169.1 hypothetical protein ERICIII_02000 [Paenibacillus larvae subsp. larvae]AVF30946.1 hypothetical protein ERICIV_02021 [Paenibacillus larvae subsp. larvae]AVG11959.1 hypothetical protein ERICII_01558 [Paenibacillus larvae subsp. larvae DSM 25430]QHZ52207.1 hypothetical protein ERICV_03093 [Paenibacillus larvae subsp. larvae]